MILKKILSIVFVFGLLMSATVEGAISCEKLSPFSVECISFTGAPKELPITVVDVAKDDVVEIFSTLKKKQFPIYTASSFAPREIRGGGRVSLHALGAAIDVNYLMNPSFNVIEGVMIPTRKKDRADDAETIRRELAEIGISENEIQSVLDVVIQEEGSDDRFLNRGKIRKGMITSEQVEIFKYYGFSEWGGNWRQPMDYMHLQIPRGIANSLAQAQDREAREKIWSEHLANCRRR